MTTFNEMIEQYTQPAIGQPGGFEVRHYFDDMHLTSGGVVPSYNHIQQAAGVSQEAGQFATQLANQGRRRPPLERPGGEPGLLSTIGRLAPNMHVGAAVAASFFRDEQVPEQAAQQYNEEAEWPAIAQQIRQRYPNVDPEQFRAQVRDQRSRPRPPGEQLQEVMQQFRERPEDAQSWIRWAEERVPFSRHVATGRRDANVLAASRRVSSGHATPQEYAVVANFLVEHERAGARTVPEDIFNTVSEIPGFVGEFAVTRGAFSAGRAATARLVTAGLGSASATAAASVAGRVAIGTAGGAGGLAAFTAANPLQVYSSAAHRALPTSIDPETGASTERQAWGVGGTGVIANLPGGAAETAIELGSELSGAAIPGVGRWLRTQPWARGVLTRVAASAPGRGVAAVQRAMGGVTGALNAVGYHGVAGEFFEERVGDFFRGLTGLTANEDGTHNYGMASDALAGRWDRVSRQTMVEVASFAVLPGMFGAARIGNRRINTGNWLPGQGPSQTELPEHPGESASPQQMAAWEQERYRVGNGNSDAVINWAGTAPAREVDAWLWENGLPSPTVSKEEFLAQAGEQGKNRPWLAQVWFARNRIDPAAHLVGPHRPATLMPPASPGQQRPAWMTPPAPNAPAVPRRIPPAAPGPQRPAWMNRSAPGPQAPAKDAVPTEEQLLKGTWSKRRLETAKTNIKSFKSLDEAMAYVKRGKRDKATNAYFTDYAEKHFKQKGQQDAAIADPAKAGPDVPEDRKMLMEVMQQAGLDEREQAVYLGRHDLLDDPSETLKTIAGKLGVDESTAKRIEEAAVAKIKAKFPDAPGGSIAEYNKARGKADAEIPVTPAKKQEPQGKKGRPLDAVGAVQVKLEKAVAKYVELSESDTTTDEERQRMAEELRTLDRELQAAVKRARRAGKKEGRDDVVFAPPAPGAATGTTPGDLNLYAINNKVKELFKVPEYIDTPPGATAEDAAYSIRARAMFLGKMRAGDAYAVTHEAGHHVATEYRLPTNPMNKAIPADVVRGAASFDYDPKRPMGIVKLHEGFAEWFANRALGTLGTLTADQQAAADYYEAFLAEHKLTEKANRIRDLYKPFRAQDPISQAKSLVSQTGVPARLPRSMGEVIADVKKAALEGFADNIESRWSVLGRMEDYMKEKGLDHQKAALAMKMFYMLNSQVHSMPAEFERDGAKSIINGEWRTVEGALPLHVILQTVKPEEVENGEADLFVLARHVLDEMQRAEDKLMLAKVRSQNAEDDDAEAAEANLKKAEKNPALKLVPPEWRQRLQLAMPQFEQDQEKFDRLTIFADRYTMAMNSTIQAQAHDVHLKTQEEVDSMIADKPMFAPTSRVLEGYRKAQEYDPDKARTGGGEQMYSPLKSLFKRYKMLAFVMTEQIKKNHIAPLFEGPMGAWAVEDLETEWSDEGKILSSFLAETLGFEDHEITETLKEWGISPSYFASKPWVGDGTKPTWWWRDATGTWRNWRIADKSLYELITNQQGNSNSLAVLLRAAADYKIFGKKVLPLMAEVQRRGAVSTTRFTLWNALRDSWEFFKNTIDRGSVRQLPAAFIRAYRYEWALLTNQVPKDEFFKLYHDAGGRAQLRYAAAPALMNEVERKLAGKRNIAVRAYNGTASLAKSLLDLLGAAEMAPRFLEFTNYLKKKGYSEKRIEEMAARGENVPYHILQEAMYAGAEVTVPFGRKGIIVDEINKIQPFFGPAIAGMSKAVRNWKDNPKGALIALAGLMSLRLLHWLFWHDEEWYRELSSHDRYVNIVVPVPGLDRPVRLPGPRDLDVSFGGSMTWMLDMAYKNNPDTAGFIREGFFATMPPLPVTPAGAVTGQLMMNRNFLGSPIVPRRDQNLPASHNLVHYQLPYAAAQLTGGRAELSMRGTGLIPFSQITPNRSISEYYDRLRAVEGERALARRSGGAYAGEAEYARLHHVEQAMQRLSMESRGLSRQGTRTVNVPMPTAERLRAIRNQQVALARQALGHPAPGR